MNNVENRVVEMTFDNAQFEKAVAQTMSTLDKFKEKLNFDDAGKGFDKLGNATSNYTGILGSIGSAIDSVADHFSNLSGVGGRVFDALTSAATGFLTSGINKLTSDIVQGGQSRAMNLEQAKFQLQGILGNAEEVNRVIYDDILPALQGTPFSLDQAAVVMGQLAASGKTSAEEVQQGTRAIAGAAAMTNSSFADMGRIFTKVAGNGRVMGDTLQEMSSRGLNAAADISKFFNSVNDGTANLRDENREYIEQMVADITGGIEVTEADIRELVTQGQISYDAFAATMDSLYGEQATKSTTMYTGALEDLRAALARIGAEPQAVKLEFLRDAFNALVPAVDAVNAVLKPLWNSAHQVTEELDEQGNVIGTKYAKEFAGPVAQSIQKAGWAFQSLFVQLDDNHDILRYTEKNMESFGYQVRELEDGSKEYFEVLEDGTEVVHGFGEAVMNHDMLRIMTSGAQSAVNIFSALFKILKAVGQGILDAFPKIGLKNIADTVDGFERFTAALKLSDNTLQNIKFAVQAVFTPVGLLARAVGVAAKVLFEFGRIVYNAVAPVLGTLFSMIGAASGIFSGLGKAVDNAAADITSLAMKLYDATKSFVQFLHLDTLVGYLQAGLVKLTSTFTKVGVEGYNFLHGLSENAKKFGTAIYKKLRLDEFGEKLIKIKNNMRSAFAAMGHRLGFEKIVIAFTRIKESIVNLFSSTLSFEKIGSSISGFVNRLLDMIPTDKMLAALDRFSDYIIRVIFAISGFLAPKVSAAFEFFVRLADSIKKVFNTLKFAANTLGLLNTLKILLWGILQIIPRLFGFKSFGDILDNVKSKLEGFIRIFKTFVQSITDGITGNATRFHQNMKSGLTGFVDDKITGKIKKFTGLAKALGDVLGKTAGGIGKRIKEFFKALSEGDKKKIIATLSMLVMAFGYIRTITRIGKTVKSVKGVFDAFSGIGESIKKIGTSMAGVAKAVKRITMLIGVTTSLLIFAAALSILGRMDMDTLIQGGIAAIGSLIALSVSLALLDKVANSAKGGAKNIIMLAGAMGAVGAAIYLISKAMINLAEIYKTGGPKTFLVVAATIGVMMVAFGILAKEFSKMDKMQVSLKSAGLAMLAISTAIKIMVGSMQAVGSMDIGSLLKGGLTIAAFMGLMIALSAVAGKNANTAAAATALASLTASLLALVAAIWLFGNMDPGTWALGIIKMAVALSALMAVLAIFKTVAGPKEAGGIVLVAVAMGVLAGALLLLAAVPFIPLVKAMAALAIGIIVVAGAMALMSGIGIGMLAVAGAFALLGVAMLFVGAGALALAVALSMLIPLFMAFSAIPKDLIQGGLDVLAMIAEGLKLTFFDLAKGVLAFGAALLVAAVAAAVLGVAIIAIGAGLVITGVGLLALAGGIAVLSLTIQAFFGGEFLSTIGNALSNFGSLVVSGLGGLVDKVKGIFSKEEGQNVAKPFLEGGEEGLEKSSEGFNKKFLGVIDEAKDSADKKSGEFKDTMANLMASGGEGIEEGMPSLTDAFGEGLGDIQDLAGDKSFDISSVLAGVPTEAGSAITGNIGDYTGALKGMFDSGNLAINDGIADTVEGANKQSKAYSDTLGGSTSTKNAEAAGKAMKDSSKKPFANIYSDFKPYGENAASGFKAGIHAKAQEAADEAAEMVRKAIRAAKDAEDSNSPSKEFAKLGRYADEGYIVGIKSMSRQVANAASDMVNGGINAVRDAISYIAEAYDMDADFTPTITPVVDLSNVDQSVNQMGSMFNSAFGVTTPFGAMNAAFAAQSFADSRNQNARMDSINKLASKIDAMTETMNSRSLNNYITVDGASDPEMFADDLIRSFRLNARTV